MSLNRGSAAIKHYEYEQKSFQIRMRNDWKVMSFVYRHTETREQSSAEGPINLIAGAILNVIEFTPTEHFLLNMPNALSYWRITAPIEDSVYEVYINRVHPFPSQDYDVVRVLAAGVRVRIKSTPGNKEYINSETARFIYDNIHHADAETQEILKNYKLIAKTYPVMGCIAPNIWLVNLDSPYSLRREMFTADELEVVQAWEERNEK